MKARTKRPRGFYRTLLLAVSISVLSSAMAHAQEDLGALNNQVLDNPQDSALSLRYARAAEAQGELRLALGAYERVLINDPNNAEARAGYARMRRAIEPAYTFARLEVGERWDSNPLNLTGDGDGAFQSYGRATVVDERRIGPSRWRSVLNLEGEITPDFEQLNYGYAGAQTGPLFDLTPHLTLLPSVGGGAASLDGAYYFDDFNGALTLEGQHEGLSYWTRLRGGWRNYGEQWVAGDGPYGELTGGITAPRVFSQKDSLVVQPWVRWSGIEGVAFNFQLNEPVTPGEYAELGIDATYNYRLSDHLLLSAGIEARDRHYTKTKIAGEDRHDTYASPHATLSLTHMLPCNCSINLNYRYRSNSSNDFTADYDAHQASISLSAQF